MVIPLYTRLVGPMENAEKEKDLNSFLTIIKMYFNKPRINHLGI